MDGDVHEALKPLLAGYPIVLALPVQWGDQDSFRHVNNTVYFRWYESARIVYGRKVGLMSEDPGAEAGPILAATANNYRRQITFPDTVHIGVRVARIGGASLGFEHVIVSESQRVIAADGTSTIVFFDYTRNRPLRVPVSIRQAIESIEGRSV